MLLIRNRKVRGHTESLSALESTAQEQRRKPLKTWEEMHSGAIRVVILTNQSNKFPVFCT